MVKVFTLVSAAIEWLGSKWEELQEAKEEAKRLKKEKDEEEERVRNREEEEKWEIRSLQVFDLFVFFLPFYRKSWKVRASRSRTS